MSVLGASATSDQDPTLGVHLDPVATTPRSDTICDFHFAIFNLVSSHAAHRPRLRHLSFPSASRVRAFWLQTNAGSILLDCSADAPHRMAAEQLDWINLDAIWISHLRLDHCAGLAPFLFGIKWTKGIEQRQKPLRIFRCRGIGKLLKAVDEAHRHQLFEQPFAIEIHEIKCVLRSKAQQTNEAPNKNQSAPR